eukprot:CAMPEP_0119024388 /NCGR_PEP_ID=MMETSP1176-20130426/31792_1 /TAXON_ID=265551 /ORGANISM="Synedropsis recta cf, Strain CCMP1620" /LENGTH=34 /DNA_ID= /DNA_START= /DNA_END= /DNA_ORIENTATION=
MVARHVIFPVKDPKEKPARASVPRLRPTADAVSG